MSTENILQGIISPKVVSDGSGGYVAKADIVNIDRIEATGNIVTDGSIATTGGISSSTSVTAPDVVTDSIGNGSNLQVNGTINGVDGGRLTLGADLDLNGHSLYTHAGQITIATNLNANGYCLLFNKSDATSSCIATQQCGTCMSNTYITISLAEGGVTQTDTPVIIVTPLADPGSFFYVTNNSPGTHQFKIICLNTITFNYFIASF